MILCDVLTTDEAWRLVDAVTGMDWKPGKARTDALTGTIKQNEEILAGDSQNATDLLMPIGMKLLRHPLVSLECIPLKVHPPKFNKHADGGQYHAHTDAPWMDQTRTDLACTIWLSPPETYDGGELHIGAQSFKGKPGQALIYECGEIHHVSPVTRGERICAITWIQSRIRDVIQRRMITDFRRFLAKVESDSALFLEGSRIYSALLKRWIE